MKCIICGSSMSFFLSKWFGKYGLDTADYWRCHECGFVQSKTHAEMSAQQWERLNHETHAAYQGTDSDPLDPNWPARLENQARILNDLQQIELLNKNGRWLDYACGDGRLSNILLARYNLNLLKYERYMPKQTGYIENDELLPKGFDFVLTTSVFEHLTQREHFDAVEALVAQQGVLGTHTLVCEEVPADPSWFYLVPVHCAFHTNKSMAILFEQWGYICSIYNVEAQLWLWFKTNPQELEAIVQRANSRNNAPKYVFKHGFVDYWKCVPIHRPRENVSPAADSTQR